jgi:hypothetical protein
MDYATLGYTYCATAASSISGTPYTWSDAQHFCQTSGKGNLATIESLTEMTFLLGNFAPTQTNPALWLGVRSRAKGERGKRAEGKRRGQVCILNQLVSCTDSPPLSPLLT